MRRTEIKYFKNRISNILRIIIRNNGKYFRILYNHRPIFSSELCITKLKPDETWKIITDKYDTA